MEVLLSRRTPCPAFVLEPSRFTLPFELKQLRFHFAPLVRFFSPNFATMSDLSLAWQHGGYLGSSAEKKQTSRRLRGERVGATLHHQGCHGDHQG